MNKMLDLSDNISLNLCHIKSLVDALGYAATISMKVAAMQDKLGLCKTSEVIHVDGLDQFSPEILETAFSAIVAAIDKLRSDFTTFDSMARNQPSH